MKWHERQVNVKHPVKSVLPPHSKYFCIDVFEHHVLKTLLLAQLTYLTSLYRLFVSIHIRIHERDRTTIIFGTPQYRHPLVVEISKSCTSLTLMHNIWYLTAQTLLNTHVGLYVSTWNDRVYRVARRRGGHHVANTNERSFDNMFFQ